jgi:hypothetical protein
MSDLEKVRANLAYVAEVYLDFSPEAAVAAALLLLLPPTPVEDRHTVDDVPPNDIVGEEPRWVLGDHMIRVAPGSRHSVQWMQGRDRWSTTPAEAEEFAAVLLSAVARARRAETT